MNYNTVRLRDAHAGAICLAVEFLQQYYVRTKRKELPVLKFLLYCTALSFWVHALGLHCTDRPYSFAPPASGKGTQDVGLFASRG